MNHPQAGPRCCQSWTSEREIFTSVAIGNKIDGSGAWINIQDRCPLERETVNKGNGLTEVMKGLGHVNYSIPTPLIPIDSKTKTIVVSSIITSLTTVSSLQI
jgi:hypothetical protein